jgi:hypothetical protein
MRARHAVFTAVVGITFVMSAPALAQPPPPPPVVEPAEGKKAPSTWQFRLSAQGTWYENAQFLGPIAEDSAWSTTGQASLSNESRFQDGSFTFSGFVGGIYYPEIDAFNQPTYGGSLGLNWTLSRRTRLTLDLKYEQSNTRFLGAVDSEGPPLPTSVADYATAAIGLQQQLSQRWQLDLIGNFNYRRYDDPLLTGSDQIYASVGLGRQIGMRGRFYFTYVYSSSWFELVTERAHQVLVGGRHSIERGVGIDIAGGVGYLESTEEFYPAGRVGISAVGRRSRLEVGYYRDFGQAYGYGRQTIGDLVYARLSWAAVRKLTFNASYNYGYRRDPLDDAYTIKSGIASVGLGWDVGGGVGFSGNYSWERNETEGLPVFEGGRAMASLSYGVSWR